MRGGDYRLRASTRVVGVVPYMKPLPTPIARPSQESWAALALINVRRVRVCLLGLGLVGGLLLLPTRQLVAQGVALPAVTGLVCDCRLNPLDESLLLTVSWQVPQEAAYEGVEVQINGAPVVILPPDVTLFQQPLDPAFPGAPEVTITGVAGNTRSPPAVCTPVCGETPVAPVLGVACGCLYDPQGDVFLLDVTWEQVANQRYDEVRVFLEGQQIGVVGGEEQAFGIEVPRAAEGARVLSVVGVSGGIEAPAVECPVDCEVVVPPVNDLACLCELDKTTGVLALGAAWQNPVAAFYDAIRVLVDGVEIAILGGQDQNFSLQLPPGVDGEFEVTIIPLRQDTEATPSSCISTCELGPLPSVENLACACEFDVEAGVFRIDVGWETPENAFFDAIDLFVDDLDPIPLDASIVEFPVNLGPDAAGAHKVVVVGRRGDETGPPVQCDTTCKEVALPVLKVDAPEKVLLPARGFAEVLFDARGSTDANGKDALRFLWEAVDAPPGAVEILQPKQSFTRVRFFQGGVFAIRLTTFSNKAFSFQFSTVRTVAVVSLIGAVDFATPLIAEVPESTLFAVAGRPFRRTLTLLDGSGPLVIEVLKGPKGLTLEPETLGIAWTPELSDANTKHELSVRVSNDGGAAEETLVITVLDPGQPTGIYDFQTQSRDELDGQFVLGNVVLGEGGVAATALPVLIDRGPFEPPLDLYLQLGDAPECAVQRITPDDGPNGDDFAGVRFAPDCAEPVDVRDVGDGGGAGLPSGGVYQSGSSATSFFDAVENDFSVEVWLTNTPTEQPAGEDGDPAFIFAMASGTTSAFNWVIGAEDGEFVGMVRTTAAEPVVVTRATTDFSDASAHQLVLVREGNAHRLYVDGALATEVLAENSSLDWNPTYDFLLGNDGTGTVPFAGDVLLTGAYPEAMSSELIDFLFDLGPEIPAVEDVPAPIAEICPDPREVERGVVDVDGSLSSPGLGGEGGGAGVAGCSALLRPFEWTLEPERPDMQVLPKAGEEDCLRLVGIDYDRSGGTLFLGITLQVTQVPVRGIVRSTSQTKGIELPTPEIKRGRVNTDDDVDIRDPVAILFYLFVSGPAPGCLDAADANDDGDVDLSDTVHLLNFLFKDGSPPVVPFTECGLDGTADTRGCSASPCS